MKARRGGRAALAMALSAALAGGVGSALGGAALQVARAQDAAAVLGAPSPQEAAAGLLEAWKSADAEALQRYVPEPHRAEAARLLQASTVTAYTLGDIEESEDGQARCNFTWTVRLDEQRFVEVVLEAARARAVETGASEDQVAKQIASLREVLPLEMPAFKAHFEKQRHVMELVRIDGRWFVEKPIEVPEARPQSPDAPPSNGPGGAGG